MAGSSALITLHQGQREAPIATKTKNATATRKGDYTAVEMVRGFIEPRDARRHVIRNLDAFSRVAKGGRGHQIARWALETYVLDHAY